MSAISAGGAANMGRSAGTILPNRRNRLSRLTSYLTARVFLSLELDRSRCATVPQPCIYE
jgi:hypothetical protein